MQEGTTLGPALGVYVGKMLGLNVGPFEGLTVVGNWDGGDDGA